VNTVATLAMMVCVLIIIGAAMRRWIKTLGPDPEPAASAVA
jgi:hypothetical protein